MSTAAGNGHDGAVSGGRPPRLPRWTRQEILVLIQGKKVAESRGRGRVGNRVHHMLTSAETSGETTPTTTPLVGSGPLEPKWASVSSYCKRHGVDRGSVQCRKRWSNLAGDYKKIKEWERERERGGGESYWNMRNDLRRERKLPGFFDREVFEILDGRVGAEERKEERGKDEEEEEEVVFDSGRAVAEEGLFSDFEEDEKEGVRSHPSAVAVAATPISERMFDPSGPSATDQGKNEGKQPEDDPEKGTTQNDQHKRQRTSPDETIGESSMQNQLIESLERSSRMLTAQLEAQNINAQLDRDQRKEQTSSVIEVLGKLADALGKIAEKL